jgi:hypothetical protein
MLDNVMDRGLFSLVETSHLRLEAMHLFEQCLTSGDESALVTFIENQLAQEPPRIQLLRDLADDLQQRLLSLREYHFDVRDRAVRTLDEDYHIDITPLAPPALLDQYHNLTPDAILAYIDQIGGHFSDDELPLIRKMLEASLQIAAQLQNDIRLTSQLHNLVLDWLEGINVTLARQQWNLVRPGANQNDTQLRH